MKFLSIFLLAFSGFASAQSLGQSPTIGTFGNWRVVRSVNQMTDKATCTGLLQASAEFDSVQLSQDSLYIKIRGGLQGVTLRFDEQQPRKMRLATKTEKAIRSIEIMDEEFNAVQESTRLRFSVLTLVAGIVEGSLDVTGIKDAQKALVDCGPPSKS